MKKKEDSPRLGPGILREKQAALIDRACLRSSDLTTLEDLKKSTASRLKGVVSSGGDPMGGPAKSVSTPRTEYHWIGRYGDHTHAVRLDVATTTGGGAGQSRSRVRAR